ncbi:MAG: hypothetical protein RLZZ335_992 [Bacteroidota bacterium]
MHRIVFLKLLIGLVMSVFCGSAVAQVRRELFVVDSNTRIPLPFVALQSLDSGQSQATTSDVEGRFFWLFYGDSARIEARCVGYSRKQIAIGVGDPKPFIALRRSTTDLPEIYVKAGENPAHRIIEEAIKRKKEHDPAFMGAHRCTLYHRFMLTIDTTGRGFTDTIRRVSRGDSIFLDSSQYELAEFIRARDLMLSESLVLRHYPGATQPSDRMLATRTAGIQSPLFAVFSAQMQNFSVYNDPIRLNDIQYSGPLSPGSVRRYRFYLEESRLVEGGQEESRRDENGHYESDRDTGQRDENGHKGADTLHVIRFRPYPGSMHDGLTGTIFIHSRSYAVQQVTAEPADPQQASGLRFNQLFRQLPNGRWYPHQTHTDLWLNQVQVNTSKVVGQVFTQYTDVEFKTGKEQPASFEPADARRQRDVQKIGLTVLEDAAGQPIGYFEPFRPDSLNERDRETYRFIDSMGTETRLDQKLQWGESLLTGKIALFKGRLDLNLPEVLSANGWEGLRLGVGLSTGDSLAQRIRLGGYAAYGFGDRTPKFGGFVDVYPDKQRSLRLRISARDDIRVNGGYRFFHAETALFSTQPDRLLALFNRFFDRERVAALQFRWMNLGPWSGEAGFLVGHRQAAIGRSGSTSNYRFNNQALVDSSLWPTLWPTAPSFPVSEWSLHIRYAPGETFVRLPGRTYTIQTSRRLPVLSLSYERGLPIHQESIHFHRLLLRAERHFGMRRLGTLDAVLNLGAAWGPDPLPVQQLLYVRGTGPNSGLFVPLVFQTFDMASFAGNRIASIHLQHRVGVLHLKSLKQSPLFTLHYNAGWSHLADPRRHIFIMNEALHLPLLDLPKGYFEGGISLSRLRILGNNLGAGLFYGIPGSAYGRPGTVWLADGSTVPLSQRRWAIKLVLTP